ncbi:polyprenyl synthetase family protein [Candidatus Thioglobus sp.]|jgi:octaprenyl-diphosphate synthase|nr:polyprenyl synthetase family protein [Candidatus Thioglobus sp.]MDA8981049.1 polyprenyl synthetase family protein [Candidatus Thioglobus sp.]MDA9058231.1 polyprenyl synthetase family protein [Candidatus Thioglobus sp.]MDA9319638.1 polyprenyl synthetase family protein [Candidatus Thioglobus sp.]|tara:strand:+ start:40 stop:1011 length:972 start_codon:yes stop_codon:yes gene_type:complete
MQNFSEIHALMKSDLVMMDEILVNRLDSNVDLISQMSQYIINSGGKRIRPLLLLLCARATNYKGDYHHSMAVVIELIHTATLLHDDVVDSSSIRRGHETANELWGNAPSVLVGDFLYSRAFEIMVEPNSMQIMKILSKATNQISEGEVLQLLSIKNANVSQTEYFEVIERKTACLFKAACQIAGILAESNKNVINGLGSFGMHLGNAFQIIDDTLDYESNSSVIGKEVGDDLSEGKVTLPMIYALENTKGSEKATLSNAITNADSSNIDNIINILLSVNAFEYSRKVAKNESTKALKFLEVIPNSEYRSALQLLCELSLDRNS